MNLSVVLPQLTQNQSHLTTKTKNRTNNQTTIAEGLFSGVALCLGFPSLSSFSLEPVVGHSHGPPLGPSIGTPWRQVRAQNLKGQTPLHMSVEPAPQGRGSG